MRGEGEFTPPGLRSVADVMVDRPEERDDGGLVGGDAVEIAHRYGGMATVADASSSDAAMSAFLASPGKLSKVH
jgi:hypothetical protein